MFRRLRFLVVFLVGLVSASCGFTSQGEALRNAVDVYGSQGADALLENAEFVICRAAPVGAVTRRYGTTPELFAAWQRICVKSPVGPFAPLEERSQPSIDNNSY